MNKTPFGLTDREWHELREFSITSALVLLCILGIVILLTWWSGGAL